MTNYSCADHHECRPDRLDCEQYDPALDSRTQDQNFVVEVHRYSHPEEIYRFFYFEPRTEENARNEWTDRIVYHPFSIPGSYYEGPEYVETESQQVRIIVAEHIREQLDADGYVPSRLDEQSSGFQRWIIHTQCPIEWHSALDSTDHDSHEEAMGRITVWIQK